ncbi:DgyrCDS4515 [Dimorphilus gyrociliatus]|uniref:ascorbate ferrireductase (transmembrane) n=1 Tax=Dimorphilus gyrociliatus TaxID=2664684 RepID=A0A7I8VIN7_9ANNE|nr:DgyrCDS4515 [Dimorphilus gyrociliatus]
MVAHFVCILFTGFIIYKADIGSSLFSWHPSLMALACSLFIVQAIMVFNSQSSLLMKLSRKTRVLAHRVLSFLGVTCAWLAFLAIYTNKNNNNKAHFTTWHGLIGFIALLYMTAQSCGGNLLIYTSLLSKTGIKWKDMKMYHATSGFVLYVLICGTMVLGMFSNWFVKTVTGTSWYACLACPAILSLVVMQQVTQNNLPKPGNRKVEEKK